MKKVLILAGICLSLCGSLMAQPNGRPNGGPRGRFNLDAVVDTAVINHIGLPEATLQQVYELQKNKMEVQLEMFKSMRPGRGQRLSEEERQAMNEKRQAFTTQYRQELRAIVGDAAYITYLEKLIDHQATQRFGRMGNFGGQRMGGQQPGGGGFGGEGFGGNGFGGGFDN